MSLIWKTRKSYENDFDTLIDTIVTSDTTPDKREKIKRILRNFYSQGFCKGRIYAFSVVLGVEGVVTLLIIIAVIIGAVCG